MRTVCKTSTEPRRVDWNAHVWTMTTSLHWSVGAVDAVGGACVLCACRIQNDWVSRATNLQQMSLSLNIPPRKLFGWFRRLQLRATGDLQLHHNNTPAHTSHLVQSVLLKLHITQVTVPLQPRCATLWLLAFPKTKITFEREQISDHQWDSGKYDGAGDGYWENCVRSQGS